MVRSTPLIAMASPRRASVSTCGARTRSTPAPASTTSPISSTMPVNISRPHHTMPLPLKPRVPRVGPTSKSTDLYISALQHISQHIAASARCGKDESRRFDGALGRGYPQTERDTLTWVSRLEHQPFLEGPRAVARHLKLSLPRVLESDDQAPAEPRTDVAHPGQVDDRAAVNANELPRIQPLLELTERPVDQMTARHRHGQGAFPLGQEVRDLGGLHELRTLLAQIDADPVGVHGPPSVLVVASETLEHGLHTGRAGIGAATLEALERALDALALDWLQQIVHRRGIEGLQRVIVEGGDEDD